MQVLVDTSIWIDFLRNPGGGGPELAQAIRSGQAVICPVIHVEIWSGIKGKREETIFREMTELCPTPPLPSVYLDATNTKVEEIGWGKAQFGKSISGKPLSLDGKTADKGLGVHAKALAISVIPKNASRFVASVGIDDLVRKDERPSVTFEVYGDVKEMGEPPVLLAQSPVLSVKGLASWNFKVELSARFKELRLVVTDAGDGITVDHADWVNAGFLVAAEETK